MKIYYFDIYIADLINKVLVNSIHDAPLPTRRLEFIIEINIDYFRLQFIFHSTKIFYAC